MAELNIETVIKSGYEKVLNKPIVDGKSITEWAAIGMKAPRWISVKDRLPEEDGTMRGYLVAVGNWVGIMPFFGGAFREDLNGKKPDYHVHHWMPLPSVEGLDGT